MENVHKRQNLIIVTASIIVLIACAIASPVSKALSCQHQNTSETITKQSTCTEDGEREIVCEDCGDIVEKVVFPAKGHLVPQVRSFYICSYRYPLFLLF